MLTRELIESLPADLETDMLIAQEVLGYRHFEIPEGPWFEQGRTWTRFESPDGSVRVLCSGDVFRHDTGSRSRLPFCSSMPTDALALLKTFNDRVAVSPEHYEDKLLSIVITLYSDLSGSIEVGGMPMGTTRLDENLDRRFDNILSDGPLEICKVVLRSLLYLREHQPDFALLPA